MNELRERHGDVDGLEAFWREGPSPEAAPPVLYVHGVPVNADIWTAFLERTGGFAPDLPGFGRSAKPADFDYSIGGIAGFLEAFTAHAGVDRLRLVVHDWGAGPGLAFAQRFPERIERLVVLNSLPLLPGYRWHRIARVWRTPLAGELFMGFSFKWNLRILSREASGRHGPMPDEFIDLLWDHFDHGTQRAILKLYRSAPEEVLVAAGKNLDSVKCPALVAWGRRDPYIPTRFANDYARALGGKAEVEIYDDAGHWGWYQRPEMVERVAGFLARSDAS